ncbi:MAG: guanylate kinase [Gemmatimonadaceae bacterium]|nr:guanylate kinase [Gemmatimonadaceae bacterium]
MKPFPVILSSPSGAGKTSLAKQLLELRPDTGYSVSCTTRAPRAGEEEGRDYYFMSVADFEAARSRGAFAESANVHGNMYGTLRSEIERVLGSARHVVMDIDVQGAKQLASAFPQSVLIFILPPSAEVLLGRLKGRGSEDDARLKRRLGSAITELGAVNDYHYVVVNDDLDRATTTLSSILDGEAVRTQRLDGLDRMVGEISRGISEELELISKRTV